MPGKDIIVIGASAGGIEALKVLFASLPADLPAAIFTVVHTSPQSPAVLAKILTEAGPLTAEYAQDGSRVLPGRIYVAPPDRHLIIEPNRTCVTKGPKENRFRPAIDPLFRSAAQVYGPRVVGVILTGGLDDGTSGLWTIKRLGGTAIVQEPEEALVPSMPRSALEYVRVDYCLRLAEIGPMLVHLAHTSADEKEGEYFMPEKTEIDLRIAKEGNATEAGVLKWGDPSLYTCPDCHGVLLQNEEGAYLRFRCHTGHGYTMKSLMAELDSKIEGSLWGVIRTYQERMMLTNQLVDHLRVMNNDTAAEELVESVQQMQQQVDRLRPIVLGPSGDGAGKAIDELSNAEA